MQMITISGIIGVTVFQTSGTVLDIAGPGGVLTAFAYIGCVAIFVMEGLSEMVVLWYGNFLPSYSESKYQLRYLLGLSLMQWSNLSRDLWIKTFRS